MAPSASAFPVSNYPVLVHIVAALLAVVGAAMLLPALVEWANGDPHAMVFFRSAIITMGAGAVLFVSTRMPTRPKIRLKEAFLLTTILWVALPAFAAIPFLGLGFGFADAFFESVSGITATGATVLTGLDDMPRGILLWRAVLQWIGGIGIVVMAMVLLPFLGIGGMQLFRTESSDRSEQNLGRSSHLVGWILIVYLILTLACAMAYGAAGMSVFDAISHAFTTVSTAGYSTHDASLGFFQSAAIEWIAIVFMILGALPFIALIGFLRGDFRRLVDDPQVRWILLFLAAMSFAMAVWLTLRYGLLFGDAFRLTAFNVVSIVTTTGFASTDYMLWGEVAVILFFLLTFVGGCTGSTAGGIKIYRFVILAQVLRAHFRLFRDRSRVELVHYGRNVVPPDVPMAVLAFLILYMASVVIVTLALTAGGLEFLTALSAAATAISNVGPGVGDLIGPAGNFSSLSGTSKTILSFAMILGRLELFTVIVLLDPDFWRW